MLFVLCYLCSFSIWKLPLPALHKMRQRMHGEITKYKRAIGTEEAIPVESMHELENDYATAIYETNTRMKLKAVQDRKMDVKRYQEEAEDIPRNSLQDRMYKYCCYL